MFPPRQLRWSWAILLLVVVRLAAHAAPAWAEDVRPGSTSEGETAVFGINELLHAAWMAVIEDPRHQQVLVRVGEPIFSVSDPRPVATVWDIQPDALTLTPAAGGRPVRLFAGQSIPGGRDLAFRQAILVKTLEYRRRIVRRGTAKSLGGELYLARVQGARAILQRDVDPPLSPMGLLEHRMTTMRLTETEPRVWEVSAHDFETAMDAAPGILPEVIAGARVDLSAPGGMALEMKTPIADARLDERGFLITDPNLAARAGLLVGDRIVAVNGAPIDGFASLAQAYLRLKNSPSVRVVQVVVERSDKPLSLTYRIR